jgi:hypothetical protein
MKTIQGIMDFLWSEKLDNHQWSHRHRREEEDRKKEEEVSMAFYAHH